MLHGLDFAINVAMRHRLLAMTSDPSLRAKRGNPVLAPCWIAASQAPRDDVFCELPFCQFLGMKGYVVIASEAWQSSACALLDRRVASSSR
jgi:hypothetical protein